MRHFKPEPNITVISYKQTYYINSLNGIFKFSQIIQKHLKVFYKFALPEYIKKKIFIRITVGRSIFADSYRFV